MMQQAERLLPVDNTLPYPDVDRMGEVQMLVDKATEAWDKDDIEEFVTFLAQAFSLDIHDFNHIVMDDPKHNRRACASVFVLGERGSDTPEYHALRIAIALVDTLGFFIFQGVCSVDLSRN
jgi:anthranilate phosphoribosyltransferase